MLINSSVVMNALEADYEIGGGWGCHISWSSTEQLLDISEDSILDVYGHHPRIPKQRQTVVGEFNNSFIKFEFLVVERQSNPSDMFFGKVKPVEQVMKDS